MLSCLYPEAGCFLSTSHPEVSGSREVLPVFMKGHGHDSVCGVECLLYSIAMMDVNINIEHPLVVPGGNNKT